MKRAGKRVAGWIGGVSGVATPGWLYFKNYTPPLFPGITWLVAADTEDRQIDAE